MTQFQSCSSLVQNRTESESESESASERCVSISIQFNSVQLNTIKIEWISFSFSFTIYHTPHAAPHQEERGKGKGQERTKERAQQNTEYRIWHGIQNLKCVTQPKSKLPSHIMLYHFISFHFISTPFFLMHTSNFKLQTLFSSVYINFQKYECVHLLYTLYKGEDTFDPWQFCTWNRITELQYYSCCSLYSSHPQSVFLVVLVVMLMLFLI